MENYIDSLIESVNNTDINYYIESTNLIEVTVSHSTANNQAAGTMGKLLKRTGSDNDNRKVDMEQIKSLTKRDVVKGIILGASLGWLGEAFAMLFKSKDVTVTELERINNILKSAVTEVEPKIKDIKNPIKRKWSQYQLKTVKNLIIRNEARIRKI